VHPLLSDEGQAALEEAIEAIEERCAAEVVVAVHRRAGAYGRAQVVLGVLVALLAQAFFLYSSIAFPLPIFLVGPFALGLLGSLLGRLPALERLFASRVQMRLRVRMAAEAAFYRHDVSHTRERTGIVVYVALFERRGEVVGDSGVLRQRPIEAWDAAVAELDATLAAGGEIGAVTAALTRLGDVLSLCLPWRSGVNELDNAVLGDG